MRTRLIPRLCAVALVCAAVACGKKGPPLAPFPNVPLAPTEVSARRSGDRVVVRFTIPRANRGGRQPANIERVDVYAWTLPVVSRPTAGATTEPPQGAVGLQPEEVFKYAKLVGSVPVRRPPPPPPEQKEGEPPLPPPPPPTGPGLDQGTVAQVEETLTPEEFQPVAVPQKKRKQRRAEVDESALTPPDVGPPLPPPPLRYYLVVGVNRHGTRGTPSLRQAVPLWTPPPPPSDVTATIREGGIDVAWTSPSGLRHPLVTNLAPTPAPVTARPGPAVPTPGTAGIAPVAPSAVSVDRPASAPPPANDEDEDEDQVSAEARSRREAAMQQAEDARVAAGHAPAQAGALEPAAPQAPTPPTTAAAGAAGNPPGAAGAGAAPTQAPAAAGVSAQAGVPEAMPTIPSRVPFPWPATDSGFMVYEVQPPSPERQDVPPLPAVQPFPKPLTVAPLKTTTFSDPRVEYGTPRCYAVRTLELVGALVVESPSSPPACVTPRDVFPPAAPSSLGAVASEGAISLIWEANTESDVAGYLVLRGVAGGPLVAITPAPIRETTYRDTTVRRGTRYAYAVVAVDTATPPNRSPESNHVEETAR